MAYRLHLGARAVAYGEKKLIYQGPYPQGVEVNVAAKLINITYSEEINLEHADNKIFEVRTGEWSFYTLLHFVARIQRCPGCYSSAL